MPFPPVVFIHGTNAGPWTMRNFLDSFAAKGFACHAPAYRFHDQATSDAQTQALVGVSIADYVEDIAQSINALGQKPVLVGHSLGGVVAQKLAARDLAAAVVLLNSSVVHGALPTTDAERALGKALMASGPFWERTLLPDFETMATYGLNRLPKATQRAVFDRLRPESGRVLFELFFWMFDTNLTTNIDFAAVKCPLLFISGTDDRAVPPSTARWVAAQYGDRAAFHPAESRGHYLMLEPGWEAIAATCMAWVSNNVATEI